MDREKLKEYCDSRHYTSRACRFKVIEALVGITEEEAKAAEKINRYLRDIFPPDEVTIKKEAEWKRSPSLAQSEADWDKTFKNTSHDLA